MPAKPNPQIAEIVALLPADGSAVTYDAWKQSIVGAGKYQLVPLTRTAKRDGSVEYFLDAKVLYVRRAAQ